MLAPTEVRATVIAEIQAILLEDGEDEVDNLDGTEQLNDIALNSLLLARLVIQLEQAVGVDPFAAEDVAVFDMRTVDDLVAAYEKAVVSASPVPAGVGR